MRAPLLIVAAAAFLLAACAAPSLTRDMQHVPDVRQFVQFAAAEGPVWVEMQGAPEAAFERVVLETWSGHALLPAGTRMTSERDRARRPDYRLVLAFGAPPGSTGQAACEDAAALVDESRVTPWRIQGAFCFRDEVLSESAARFETRPEAGDRAYRRLVWSMIPILFPEDDRSNDPDRCIPPGC